MRNELDEACFQHDRAYVKSKDLAKITQSDKVLRDQAFKIAIDLKYDGYKRELALMVQVKFLIKNLLKVVLLPSQVISLQVNLIGRLLKNLIDEKFIQYLETISGVLI